VVVDDDVGNTEAASGRSTRWILERTAGLSVDRLITQLEITTTQVR
jgi:hypothetical protein